MPESSHTQGVTGQTVNYFCPFLKGAEKTLRFMDLLFVVGISKDKRALEVVRSKSLWTSMNIEVDEYVGWVRVDQLLLLKDALQHESTLIFKKCFVVNDWRRFLPGVEHVKFEDVEAGKIKLELKPAAVRDGPGDEYKVVKTLSGIDLFSFAYKIEERKQVIGEEEQKWFLIGTHNHINPVNAEKKLLGWIKDDRVVVWDTREALEPHPDRERPAHIYATASDLVNNGSPLLRDTMLRRTWPPERWRYVIMNERRYADTDYARIGWIGPLVSDDVGLPVPEGSTEDTTAAAASFRKWVLGFWNSLQAVNIIFVIDATWGMAPYLAEAGDLARIVMENHTGRIKFGAVVYRDVADSSECIDQISLTRDADAVSLFLYGQILPANWYDRDFEEALYLGLKTALRDVAKSGENNVIILIGDAGNNFEKDSTTASDIADLAHSKWAQIHAIRVTRLPRNDAERRAMSHFYQDMKRVAEALNERKRSELRENGQEGLLAWTSYWEPPQDSTQVVQDSTQVVQDVISDRIESALREQEEILDALIADIEMGPMSRGGAIYAASGKLLQLMKRYFDTETGDASLGERIVLFLNSNSKVQVFQPGYVRLRDEAGNPLMRKVVLLSMEDLANLTRVLDEFTGTLDKKDLIRVWKEAIISDLGTIPDSPEQYVHMRTGLELKVLQPFLSRTWDELRKITDEELMNFVAEANRIKVVLRELMNSPEHFPNYGIRYTWVPAEKMP